MATCVRTSPAALGRRKSTDTDVCRVGDSFVVVLTEERRSGGEAASSVVPRPRTVTDPREVGLHCCRHAEAESDGINGAVRILHVYDAVQTTWIAKKFKGEKSDLPCGYTRLVVPVATVKSVHGASSKAEFKPSGLIGTPSGLASGERRARRERERNRVPPTNNLTE